jgi:glutamate carboxypeptidase
VPNIGTPESRAELQTFLSRLEAVCGHDSPTGNVEAVDGVAQLLASWAGSDGCEVDLFPTPKGRHLRATLTGRGTGRVLLVGHHDTVWPLDTALRRPVRTVGDRVTGPGTADMKAGLLVGLAAMTRLAAGDRAGFAALELHSLPDEEARIGPPAQLALLAGADAALVLECGRESGAIVGSRDAATWITLEAQGRSAHAGQDAARGRSALRAAIVEVDRIEALASSRDGLQISATSLVSDGPANAIPGHARATFDVRAPRNALIASLLADAGHHGDFAGVKLETSTAEGFPAMERDAALVALSLAELGSAGAPMLEEHGFGASDGCWTSSLGIPTVDGLGPIGGDDHTETEWIAIDSIGPRIEAVAAICNRATRWLHDSVSIA